MATRIAVTWARRPPRGLGLDPNDAQSSRGAIVGSLTNAADHPIKLTKNYRTERQCFVLP